MSKRIKFNLRCDGEPVRNLEDLREHFCIEDVLEYFSNGLLSRWLDVRGFQEELEAVENLKASQETDAVEQAKALAKIFGMGETLSGIEQDAYMLKYLRERRQFLERDRELQGRESEITERYFARYTQRVQDVLTAHRKLEENASEPEKTEPDEEREKRNEAISEAFAAIKAAVKEICQSYATLFLYDYRRLLLLFQDKAPLAVYVMLMNRLMRETYLSGHENADRKFCYDKLRAFNNTTCQTVKSNPAPWMKVLKVRKGTTSGIWQVIEYAKGDCDRDGNERGMNCLILSLNSGSRSSIVANICEYHENGSPYAPGQVQDAFPVLNGLEYQSTSTNGYLIYLEADNDTFPRPEETSGKPCPVCGEISDGKFCPYCGAPMGD